MQGAKRGERASAGEQAGVALLEVLISMVLIAMSVSVLTAGVIAVTRAGAEANDTSRATMLLTSFGESLEQLAYQRCSNGDLVEVYSEAWDVHNQALPAEERLLPSGSTDMAVSITDSDTAGGCQGGEPDHGEQTLWIEATVRGVTRSGQIVKTDPDYSARGPLAVITDRRVSGVGNPVGIFALSATSSTPIADIVSYEWECGDPGGTTFSTADPDDPSVECRYPAQPSADTVVTASLRVTDMYGATSSATRNLTVPRSTSPRVAPVARIAATPASGNASLTVTFSSAGSASLEGTIVEYRWNFGDPNSGSANTLVTTSPTAPQHVYERGGVFPAQLTVVDDIGLTGTATANVTVTRPGPPPPIASFTMTPPGGVTPQTVAFNASASRPDTGGSPIATYEWDFGDGATGGGVTASRRYNSPQSYTVRLTVTDTAGVSATTTQVLTLSTFSNPPNFRLTGTQPEFFSDGKFFFAWTNLGGSPGDVVTYRIWVQATVGCIAFGTQSRTVTAGAPGTSQTYEFVVPWPASNVCAGSQYAWRVETIRTNPYDGTHTTDSTVWQHFWMT